MDEAGAHVPPLKSASRCCAGHSPTQDLVNEIRSVGGPSPAHSLLKSKATLGGKEEKKTTSHMRYTD